MRQRVKIQYNATSGLSSAIKFQTTNISSQQRLFIVFSNDSPRAEEKIAKITSTITAKRSLPEKKRSDAEMRA